MSAEPQPAADRSVSVIPDATKRYGLRRGWLLRPLALASLLILALGAVEDLFGNTDSGDVYGSDAVQYLDLARALLRHDWHSALNPLWSQGYPVLLAVVRPLLPSGPNGDWWMTRSVNFLIFTASYTAFLYLLFTLVPRPAEEGVTGRQRWMMRIGACLLLFVAVQTCLGQVSRVNPDELVTTLFVLACAHLVRLLRASAPGSRPPWQRALLLGATLGAGFLVKAAFLGLGCDMLAITAIALYGRRTRLLPLLAAAALFASVVGSYGAALSRAVGYTTLGDSGAINYAWHVNRLQKWVHWEGGVQPADAAWPRPAIARFAQWSTRPPNFGRPLHPSVILQDSPQVYGFTAPVHATYVPYYDPPYFYQGYRNVFRVRYQLIALVKSLGDLLQVLLKQPIASALAVWLLLHLRTSEQRRHFRKGLQRHWVLLVCALLGITLYLPVHLEGRYIAGMLLVLGTCGVLAATDMPARSCKKVSIATAVLLFGFVAEIGLYQSPAWRNLLHATSPVRNAEWQMGEAALQQHLPPGAPVGVISWTPNLHCDWAYIAHLQITSEIASGADYDQFWRLPPDRQAATLQTFRRAGAIAVFVNGKPLGLGGPEWHQLNGTPLWMASLHD